MHIPDTTSQCRCCAFARRRVIQSLDCDAGICRATRTYNVGGYAHRMFTRSRVYSVCTLCLIVLPDALASIILRCSHILFDIPAAFQGSGYAEAAFLDGAYSFGGNLTIVENGIRHFGGSLIGRGPRAGVLTTLCVQSASTAPGTVALVLSADAKALSTLCLAAVFNTTNGTGPGPLLLDAFLPGLVEGPCKATGLRHRPNALAVASFDELAPPAPELCPLGGEFIPPELVQSMANSTAELPWPGESAGKVVPAREAFTDEGWTRELFDGQVRATACSLAVTVLPPSRSGLPGAEALWQVVFGDGRTGERASCGWWAQVGRNLTFAAFNASAEPRDACPTSLAAVATRTFVDYFPPSPSQLPTPSQTHSQYRSPPASRTRHPRRSDSQTPSPSASVSATGSPSQSQEPTSSQTPSATPAASPASFTLGALQGSAAVGATVGIALGGLALVALGVAALYSWRRHAVAMAAAALSVGVGPDGKRSSTASVGRGVGRPSARSGGATTSASASGAYTPLSDGSSADHAPGIN